MGKKLREIQSERQRDRERERAIKENGLKRILKVNAGPPGPRDLLNLVSNFQIKEWSMRTESLTIL